jgi:hypothetical protein
MTGRADNEAMTALLVILILAAFVGFGLLATRYGVDSRHADPRDLRQGLSR